MGGTGSGRRKAGAVAEAVASAARAGAAAALEHVEGAAAEEDDELVDGEALSLFPGLAGKSARELDTVLVQRLGPIPEGTLGDLQRDDGVDEIQKRWGGGKFKLVGRDVRKSNLSGAFRTIEIAGEPKFKSRAAEAEYRRQIGEPAEAPGRSSGPGSLDIIAILTKQQEGARVEHERREAERESAHKRELERLKIEAEQRKEERKAEDERRERDAREREDRESKRADEQRRHEREFYANMLKGQGSTESPISALMQGINLALKLKESNGDAGGPADPLSALLSGLPGLVDMLKAGKGEPAQAASLVAPAAPAGAVAKPAGPAAPVRPRANNGAGGRGVKLEGEIGDKAMSAIKHLQAIGQDPEKVIGELFERIAALEAPAPAAATAANGASGKGADAPPLAPEPDNVTKPEESATAQG